MPVKVHEVSSNHAEKCTRHKNLRISVKFINIDNSQPNTGGGGNDWAG